MFGLRLKKFLVFKMEDIEKIPKPTSKDFKLLDIQSVNFKPHPYCITSRHVAIASDEFGGILGKEAITAAEKRGVMCGMYTSDDGVKYANRRNMECDNRCNIPYNQHTSDRALFIKALVNKKVKEFKGLSQYLLSIKKKLIELKIDGVAFVEPNFAIENTIVFEFSRKLWKR